MDRASSGSLVKVLLCVAALAVANFISYRWQWLGLATFPDDFIGSYHAMPYQWYRDNSFFSVIPWVPYGFYGYPAFLSMQNSAFYWPLEVMKALSIPYSFENATILQLVHVLVGACGMLLFLRNYTRSWLICFIGAAAYMLSGAFYGNAQHVDTIRSYALFPCVLAVMTRSWLGAFSPARLALTSLLASFWFIGGYPGNVVASIYIFGIFFLFELHACSNWRERSVYLGQLAAAWLIAMLAAAAKYGVPLLGLGEYQYVTSSRFDFHPVLLVTMVLSYLFEPLPNDLSMRSLYLAPFLLVMMFFAPLRAPAVRMAGLLVLLFVVVTLHDAPWTPLLNVTPGLSFSRNWLADFRPALQLGMILLAVVALEHWRARETADQARGLRLALACLAVFGLLAWGWILGYPANDLRAAAISIGLAVLFAAVFVYARTRLVRTAVLLGASLATCVTAIMFFNNTPRSWVLSPVRSTLSGAFLLDVDLLDKQLQGHRTSWPYRPARELYDAGPAIMRGNRGYYSQDFATGGNDLGTRLRRSQGLRKIAYSPEGSHLRAFMAEPSAVWVLYGASAASLDDLRKCAGAVGCAPAEGDMVLMTEYRADSATYAVKLGKPALVAENELFFPHWQGAICRQGVCEKPISAGPAAEFLRGWTLPAGAYVFRTRYVEPAAPVLILMFWAAHAAMLALAFWGLIRFARRRDGVPAAPDQRSA